MTKRITPPAGRLLTVAVEGDVLTVRIGTAFLASCVQGGERWPSDYGVTDVALFAQSVAEEIERTGGEDGLSPLQRLFDDAAIAALEGALRGIGAVDAKDGIALADAMAASRLPDHIEEIRGAPHRQDAKGNWVAEEVLKPQDLIADDLVRRFVADARRRAGSLAEFRDEALAAVTSMNALLDQEYDVTFGGAKGNVTLTTIHPTMRMEVRVNDLVAFGPELKQAKALIDECLADWSAEAHPMIRALVNHAFNVDREGRANRGALLSMLRYEVADARWERAMRALRDSIRVDGTKTYVRFQERDGIEGAWRTISLDIARA